MRCHWGRVLCTHQRAWMNSIHITLAHDPRVLQQQRLPSIMLFVSCSNLPAISPHIRLAELTQSRYVAAENRRSVPERMDE